MRCPALAAQVTLCHGILKGILRHAVHMAGNASTLEHAKMARGVPALDGPSAEQLRLLSETLHDTAIGRRKPVRPAQTPWVSSQWRSTQSPSTPPCLIHRQGERRELHNACGELMFCSGDQD
jgi:hypothetical protein